MTAFGWNITCINFCFLQLNISFNDKTEVFEYPSFEPVSPVQTPEEEPEVSARLKSNTPVGSSGMPLPNNITILLIRIWQVQHGLIRSFSWLLSTPPLKWTMSHWEALPPACVLASQHHANSAETKSLKKITSRTLSRIPCCLNNLLLHSTFFFQLSGLF